MPSKRSKQQQLACTRITFERFLAAYRGEHSDALGSDAPLTDLFLQKECAVFVSTPSDSRVLWAPHESMTYVYDTSSQNSAIELRIWASNQRYAQKFNHVHSLVINSEAMAAPLVRVTIPDPTPLAVRNALEGIARIPRVSTDFKSMLAALRPWRSAKDSVECLTFRLKKSRLWIRNERDSGKQVSAIAQQLQQDIDGFLYITVLRSLASADLRFVDEFWEYQIERCREDGIYWGYKIKREMPKLSDGKDDLTYTHQVLRGMLPTPHLSWFKHPGSKPNEWLSHPFKAVFTSVDEWETIFTLALLQNVEWNRMRASDAYAAIGNDSVCVKKDVNDPSHFWLQITAASSAAPQPKVTSGTVFKINNAAAASAGTPMQALEAYAVDVEGCNDFMLELRVATKSKERVWGDCFRRGFQFQISLDHFNIQAALRQLNALQSLKYTASKADIDVLIGRPAQNFIKIDDYCSVKECLNPQLQLSFQEILARLQHSDVTTFQSHVDWQTTSRANARQYESIMAGLRDQVSFVQGPPYTGKSDVACAAALWVACLGENVLIAAPTNLAVKLNSTRLSEELCRLPRILRMKLQCVYLPTWKESIDRIYAHCGCQMAVVTQSGDDSFERVQIWRLVSDYAKQRVDSGQKDEKAKKFVDVISSLTESAIYPGTTIDTGGRDELMRLFRQLTRQYLGQTHINFIVMSTCNNAAILDRMAICFDYLIVDDAGALTEYDIAVALKIKHKGLLILGDYLQGQPVMESRGHNDFYQQASVSGFERNLQHTDQKSTIFRISYSFGEGMVDSVGIFGGYGGLASGFTQESDFYKDFEVFWLSNWNLLGYYLVQPPEGARYHQAKRRGQKKYHRIALNVANGYSSPTASGKSMVNYGYTDAGISFLMFLVENSTIITGKDIIICTPFVAQTELWQQQLSIRWPDSGVEVAMGVIPKGKEKRLMIADFTITNETGESMELMKNWNPANVLLSCGQDVLISLFNFDLIRPRLESLHLQCPTWAYFILDHLDAGDIYTVCGSSVLPESREEFLGSREQWSLAQPLSDVKAVDYIALNASHVALQRGPGQQYTTTEIRYLKTVANMRKDENAKIKRVLNEEREWQKAWDKEKIKLKSLLGVDDL